MDLIWTRGVYVSPHARPSNRWMSTIRYTSWHLAGKDAGTALCKAPLVSPLETSETKPKAARICTRCMKLNG